MDPHDYRSDDGFTVVELLVALALMALAILLMSEALRLSQRTYLRVSAVAAGDDSVLFAQVRIRQDLESLSAEPYVIKGSARVYVRGYEHSISFGREDDLGNLPRIELVRLEMMPSGTLVEFARDATDPTSTVEKETVLLESVQAVKFSYLVPTVGQGHPVWENNWPLSKQAPQAVRVEVHFRQNDDRTWPTLITHMRTEVSRLCQYDMSSDRCQDY